MDRKGDGTSLFAPQRGPELSCEDESNTLFSLLSSQVTSCFKATEVDAKGNESLRPWHLPALPTSTKVRQTNPERSRESNFAKLGPETTCSLISLLWGGEVGEKLNVRYFGTSAWAHLRQNLMFPGKSLVKFCIISYTKQYSSGKK